MSKETFHIRVRSVDDKVLNFSNVQEYSIENGLIIFEDSRTGEICRFAVANIEIHKGKKRA